MGFRVIIVFFTLLHKIVSYNPEIATKQCYGSALLNRNCKNPFEIAFGDGIFALLNHFLTASAVNAQSWLYFLQLACTSLNLAFDIGAAPLSERL